MDAMNEDNGDFLFNNNLPPQSVTDNMNNFELWGIMAKTCYAISRSRFLEISKIGLTPQKAQVLHIIEGSGGSILQNKISGIIMRRQNSVSDLVNRMVREGLIAKTKLPDDRKYLLIIGKKGREKYNKLTRQSIEMIFGVLTPRDRQILNLVLSKLLDKASSLLKLEINVLSPGRDRREISVFDLWGVLARTNNAISRSRFLEIAEGGLTPEKANILYIVQINGGSIPQNKVSSVTMRRQHSVSDLVNRMVREGLIIKTKHPESRAYIIKISKKGKEKYHNLKRDTLDTIFSVLTLEDRQNLSLVLNKLLVKSRSLLGLDFTTPF
jgi:DNA-binding MarR family transcriptional regulator